MKKKIVSLLMAGMLAAAAETPETIRKRLRRMHPTISRKALMMQTFRGLMMQAALTKPMGKVLIKQMLMAEKKETLKAKAIALRQISGEAALILWTLWFMQMK